MPRLLIALIAFGAFSFAHGQAAARNDDISIHGGKAESFINSCAAVERMDIQAGKAPLKDASGLSFCFGYIFGVWDMHNVLNASLPNAKDDVYCIPDNASGTQLAKIIVKYGNDHPEELNQAALAVVSHAFTKAFPCK